MTRGVLYYSDNQINMQLARMCRATIAASGLPITSVTLKPTRFGKNIHLNLERSYKTMFKQILVGLEAMTEDIVYFTEHDVLYHRSHFDFIPTDKETFYYSGNYWIVRTDDGFAINYDVSPLSGLVAYRDILITHFKERLELIKKQGFGYYMGFEPMTHNRVKWDNFYKFEIFNQEYPNIDLAHGNNLTRKRWKQSQFRKKPKFWNESDYRHIPGWDTLPALLDPFLTNKPLPAATRDQSLTIVIPARNEEFLSETLEDITKNKRGNTKIIAILDGEWPIKPIKDHEDIVLIHHSKSIGQRAATNEAVRMCQSKYVMKVDAHCAFDEGFDVKMMDVIQDDWTMAPLMKNLHVFNWVCESGHKRYQSPSGPCKECGKPTKKDVVWYPKPSPNSTSYRFDRTLHFQYFNEFKRRPEGKGPISESMSLQGSCFMLTRDKYIELDICDETFGSWGQQGTEVACKTWLSGGKVMVNHNTWYAHMFRTQGGDFGFPYKQDNKQVDHARKYSRELFLNNTWPQAIHPIEWLIERFKPVPDWH